MADIPTCLCQGSSWVVFAALYERHFTRRILGNALRRRGNGAMFFGDFRHQIRKNDGTIHDFGPGFWGAWGCYIDVTHGSLATCRVRILTSRQPVKIHAFWENEVSLNQSGGLNMRQMVVCLLTTINQRSGHSPLSMYINV